jgi:hypothetical protein
MDKHMPLHTDHFIVNAIMARKPNNWSELANAAASLKAKYSFCLAALASARETDQSQQFAGAYNKANIIYLGAKICSKLKPNDGNFSDDRGIDSVIAEAIKFGENLYGAILNSVSMKLNNKPHSKDYTLTLRVEDELRKFVQILAAEGVKNMDPSIAIEAFEQAFEEPCLPREREAINLVFKLQEPDFPIK